MDSGIQCAEETPKIAKKILWMQGSCLYPSNEILLPWSFDSDKEVLVLVTQSCSIILDSRVEVIAAKKLSIFDEYAPESNGKNQRVLHLRIYPHKMIFRGYHVI